MTAQLLECTAITAVKNSTAVRFEFQQVAAQDKQDGSQPVVLVITNIAEQDVKTFITGFLYRLTIEPVNK